MEAANIHFQMSHFTFYIYIFFERTAEENLLNSYNYGLMYEQLAWDQTRLTSSVQSVLTAVANCFRNSPCLSLTWKVLSSCVIFLVLRITELPDSYISAVALLSCWLCCNVDAARAAQSRAHDSKTDLWCWERSFCGKKLHKASLWHTCDLTCSLCGTGSSSGRKYPIKFPLSPRGSDL